MTVTDDGASDRDHDHEDGYVSDSDGVNDVNDDVFPMVPSNGGNHSGQKNLHAPHVSPPSGLASFNHAGISAGAPSSCDGQSPDSGCDCEASGASARAS